jgi:hypothetical protein
VSVLSRRAVTACLVVGPALWLASAVLDRVGTGSGTRVAFLASWPELIGLSVLTLIGAFLLQTLVERRLRGPADVADAFGRHLSPAFALVALVLPFLPWLADKVPAIDALAGPGRWWVFGVVAAQIAWALAAFPARHGRSTAPGSLPRAFVVFLVGAGLYGLCAFRLAPGPIYPGGDEPHYLVVTQSLLLDHDLDIANNHARGDYRAYYPAPLKPDYRVAGPNGAIYSIHPVGLSALIAPAFAVAGYRGASLFLALLAAWAAALAWRWAARTTGSDRAATVGWLAVATSAPIVLHSFAIYPECAAGLALMVGVTWGGDPPVDTKALVIRGLALASLPWLGTKFAPMSAVVLLWVAARAWKSGGGIRAIGTAGVPYAASVLAWLAWFWWLYGVPSPTAPYGEAHQMSLHSLQAGLPGLFADQEYGVIAVAPALAMAVVGWWRSWRAGDRWLVAVVSVPLLVLAATTGAFALWWGGSAPPGREVVSVLPLCVVPLAVAWQTSARRIVQQAGLEWLVFVGMAVTATFVLAHGGLLIANGRDGASELLEYLEPMRQLVRLAPSFIAFRDQVGIPLLVSTVWAVVAVVAWFAAGRLAASREQAPLVASGVGLAALLAIAMVVPIVAGPWLPEAAAVESRAQVEALDRFDALARPWAIDYTPFRLITPVAAMDALRLTASSGMRRAPQPVRVLLNARLALPAGTYRVSLTPRAGASLDGRLGLQVGRLGPPRHEWTVATTPGMAWNAEFALDVDASFVGFRAPGTFDALVDRLEVDPIAVVDVGDRLRTPPVLASAEYGDTVWYFHDDRAYLETGGFWARGHVTTTATVRLSGHGPDGVSLTLHGGPDPTPIRLATPAWSTRLILHPGATTNVLVPAQPDQRLLAVAITSDGGFVPAEHGQPGDRRDLGCWVEVAR